MSSSPALLVSYPPLFSDDLCSYVDQLLKEWGVPGISIGIIRLKGLGEVESGKEEVEMECRGFGHATLPSDGEEGKRVTDDTLFGIASNTKAFTAAAIAMLVEGGKLGWDTPITSVLPDLAFSDPVTHDKANIVDLLSHRTGLPRHEHSYQVGETQRDLVRRVKGLKPSAEFREYNQYNNQMYITSAYAVATLSYTSFTDFVSQKILKPLGMTSSTFHPYPSPELASSYITLDDNTMVEIPYGFNFSDEGIETAAGAGGLVTTSKDMLKWVELLIRGRHTALKAARAGEEIPAKADGKPLSPKSVLQMTTSHSIGSVRSEFPDDSAETYGLGFRLNSYQGEEIVKHGGDVPGFGSQVAWSSERGVGVVTLTNAADSGNNVAGILTCRVLEDLLGLKRIDWNERYRKKYEKAQAERTQKQAGWKKAAPLPHEDYPAYIGDYHDAAYDTATVCLPPSGDKSDKPPNETCARLYAALATAREGTPTPPNIDLLISAPGFFGTSHAVLQRKEDTKGLFKGIWAFMYDRVTTNQGLVLYSYDTEFEVQFLFEGGRISGMEWKKGCWGAGAEVKKRDGEGRVEVVFRKI